MNKFIGVGRLVGDPELKRTQGNQPTTIARYRIAIDRKFKKEGEPEADFIPCIAFGKSGEFAEKYLKKGMRIAVVGRIQTGSYTNKDGAKVYTTDLVVEEHEFVESKQNGQAPAHNTVANDGFMEIPDSIEEELPFN